MEETVVTLSQATRINEDTLVTTTLSPHQKSEEKKNIQPGSDPPESNKTAT